MQSMRPTAGSCLFDTRGRHTAIGASNAPAPTRCEQQSALDCSGSLSQRARRIKPADRTDLLWPRARQGTPGDADRWARRVMGQPRTGAPDRRRPWRGRCARQVRASSANLVVSSGASGRERPPAQSIFARSARFQRCGPRPRSRPQPHSNGIGTPSGWRP